MTLHYFLIAVLVVIALTFVYGNKPLAIALVDSQTRFLDALTKRFPSLSALHWTASAVSRPLIVSLLYVFAVLCLVGAVWIYQLPLPAHYRNYH